MIRLANFEDDFWQLESGETRHASHPDTFWIPPLEQRQSLSRGQVVKLMFNIRLVDENNELETETERMWVMVSEKIEDVYIGVLSNQPASIDMEEDVYLQLGSEVPFLAEHVIDINDTPSNSEIETFLNLSWLRRWSRD